MRPSRRQFLRLSAGAALGAPWAGRHVQGLGAPPSSPAVPRPAVCVTRATDVADAQRVAFGVPVPGRQWRGDSSVGAELRAGTQRVAPSRAIPVPAVPGPAAGRATLARFSDLRRHFVFEYYPWYRTTPWQHWDEAGRTPPDDIAATSWPHLGPYDSLDLHTLEQHARWIAESGVGAINLSWWGPGSSTDQAAHAVMDVMRDHDIHVTFHLEPYRDDRASRLLEDLTYLLEEYGERRRWDAFLLPQDAEGRSGPVFKLFRTIVPERVTDCHGTVFEVPDYTTDSEWRRQTDRARTALEGRFDTVTLLADSLNMGRTRDAGFDGIAIYDNFVAPSSWAEWARLASAVDLVFSFNVNPGYDGVALREVPPGSCYRAPRFEPGGDLSWSADSDREEAAQRASSRIDDSFDTTIALQTDASLANSGRGFFLVFVNSFNEWHEGHQFEPALSAHELPALHRNAYHNPPDGFARLTHLRSRLSEVLEGQEG